MGNHDEMMSKDEGLKQIRLALRRAALLYHCFSEAVVDELGEERGQELISKAIESYGTIVGETARRKAREKGLPLTPDNFESDLPTLAWKTESVEVEGEARKRVHFCPLAEELLELQEAKRARLYCWVDQAKMRAFNPEYEYLHLKNIIDGDPYCELVVRPTKRDSESG